MGESEQEHGVTRSVNIPIDWHEPENLLSQYASNVFVQAGEYEIVLSFFQTQLPLLAGTPEENLARLEKLGGIRAECVGKITINPDLVPKFIESLQKTYDSYQELKKARG